MKLEAKRIFIPNLPHGISEDEVKQKFFKFGNVTSIEIKQRKELGPKHTSHVFAFINIDTDNQSLQQCFDEFTNKKWKGQYIEAQLAKESFLERLKRERLDEQNQNKPQEPLQEETTSNNKTVADTTNGLSKKRVVERKSSSSSSSSDDSDEEIKSPKKKVKIVPQTKAKAKSSSDESSSSSDDSVAETKPAKPKEVGADYTDIVVKNNKNKKLDNKIESVGNAPIIINHLGKKRKSKDPYREQADQKRISSMLQMAKGYQHQKHMIQSALSNIDSSKSKKIVFNENGEAPIDESVATASSEVIGKRKNDMQNGIDKMSLFNDDNEELTENDYNFKLKEQFQGKKGKDLFELQNRFNHDKRFQLDERFIDNDENRDEAEALENEDDVQRETRKQLEILGDILGKKLEPRAEKPPRKSMLRFDPSQPEHSKYEIVEEKKEHKKLSKKEKAKEIEKEKEQLPAVSKETFYEVTDTLKEALTEKESFSLLTMFGRSADDTNETQAQEDAEEVEDVVEENGAAKKKLKGNSLNPFRYDSSDEDDDEEETDGVKKRRKKIASVEAMEADAVEEKQEEKKSQSVNLGPGKLWITETFFFKEDDYRLQEGFDFIKRIENEEEEAGYNELRQNLKKIVKKKMLNNRNKETKFKKKLGSSRSASAKKNKKRMDRALER